MTLCGGLVRPFDVFAHHSISRYARRETDEGVGDALDPFAGKGSPYYKGSGPIPWGGGREHVGKPYQVAGRWFKPKVQPNYDKSGVASWYGEAFHRRKTSNGEWFDMNRLTAAHATLPLPSYVKVTNLANGREVIVRVNDRGPFHEGRIIDLSYAAAAKLDILAHGSATVEIEALFPSQPLPPATLTASFLEIGGTGDSIEAVSLRIVDKVGKAVGGVLRG